MAGHNFGIGMILDASLYLSSFVVVVQGYLRQPLDESSHLVLGIGVPGRVVIGGQPSIGGVEPRPG